MEIILDMPIADTDRHIAIDMIYKSVVLFFHMISKDIKHAKNNTSKLILKSVFKMRSSSPYASILESVPYFVPKNM